MATTGVTNVARRAYNVEVSPQFDGYSAVRIYVGTDENGDDIVYEAGNVNGRVLEIQNEMGTQAMANNILSEIRGYQYQPVTADDALLDPSSEIGDGVTINGVYSGVFVRSTQFGRLMASDVGAPTDEEIAHEYSVESAQTDREFSRFVKSTKASLALTATEISAEVSRATTAEGTLRASITVNANNIASEISRAQSAEEQLSSRITQTATEISAEVTATASNKLNHTRTNSTFGWKLTSSSFSINSNNSTNVFYADKNGIKIRGNAEVTGKITATSGYIGNNTSGFTIRSTSIANGKTSLNDNYQGVYIGTDGIALGSNFKVDSLGNVTASSMTANNIALTGYLKIGDDYIYANSLRSGAEYALDGHESWDWSTGTVSGGYENWDWSTSEVYDNGWYWSDGASAGYEAQSEWYNAHSPYSWVGDIYASGLITNSLTCYGDVSIAGGYVAGYPMNWVSVQDKDGSYHYLLGYY